MKGERIAFVPPRYGRTVVGGAEILARMLVEELHSRGWPVEILTTDAVDLNRREEKERFVEEVEVINGITVRRFPWDRTRLTRRFHRLERRIVEGKRVSFSGQEFWSRSLVCSSELLAYLEKHVDDYRAFVFIPYLFGTTYWGIKTVPQKSYLIPCLHDEPYARLEIFRRMMHSVRGIMFNTPPEMDLARRLYGEDIPGKVVGGVAFYPYHADGERFRHIYSIRGDFVLYTGRREKPKNTPLLVEYFCNYLENSGRDVKLVLAGSNSVEIPMSFRNQIIDLGYLEERDKRDAYAAASVVCQPSVRESLSLVLLEAWLAEVPCLVHGACAVTRYHVERSGGGLWFEDYPTFHEALDFLLDHPEVRRVMGRRGKEYLLENYSWDLIVERFQEVLEEGERRKG